MDELIASVTFAGSGVAPPAADCPPEALPRVLREPRRPPGVHPRRPTRRRFTCQGAQKSAFEFGIRNSALEHQVHNYTTQNHYDNLKIEETLAMKIPTQNFRDISRIFHRTSIEGYRDLPCAQPPRMPESLPEPPPAFNPPRPLWPILPSTMDLRIGSNS